MQSHKILLLLKDEEWLNHFLLYSNTEFIFYDPVQPIPGQGLAQLSLGLKEGVYNDRTA